jgi:hypothetical protein
MPMNASDHPPRHDGEMPEESPPPFIVIRNPVAPPIVEPYDRALELVGLIHEIVSAATTRFYLKDRLDRAATSLVFELGRAAKAVSTVRWRNYRAASDHGADVATVLDIFVSQNAAPELELGRARVLVRDLVADIAPRCNG